MEVYYRITYLFYGNGLELLTAFCLYSFVKPFIKEKKRVWLVGAGYFFMIRFLAYMPWYIESAAAYILGIGAAFLVMLFLERENVPQKIFLSVTFYSLRWLALAMQGRLESYYYWCSVRLPGYAENVKLQFILYALDCILDWIFSFLLLWLAVLVVKKSYIYKQLPMTKKEMVIMLIPSLSGMLGYIMQKYYDKLYEADTGKCLFDLHGAYDLLCFLSYGIYYAAILVFILLYQSLKKGQLEERQSALMAGQIADMKSHIREVERLYQDMRSLKHDMGNHVMVLEHLYNEGEQEAAGEYLTELKRELYKQDAYRKTGNPVTDVILTEKGKEAERKGIVFKSGFIYPDGTSLNAFDVSILLQNALSNAIEAAEQCEEPYVSISSFVRKKVYMIEVRNRCGKAPVLGEDGLPVTSKEEKEGHGFGLANMRKVAAKYYGDIEICFENGEFVLHIMMLLE